MSGVGASTLGWIPWPAAAEYDHDSRINEALQKMTLALLWADPALFAHLFLANFERVRLRRLIFC